MKKKLGLIILFILFISCSKSSKCDTDEEILEKIKSKNVENVINGYFTIGECKKTYFINHIFDDINDVRISHQLKFYGLSVYKIKIVALKKISGVEPPKKITNDVDTTIVNFYKKWAIDRDYIK